MDSTQLEVVQAQQADYPLEAAAKRLEGKVLIRLHISESGVVESTETVTGEPILAKAAESGMKQWKFKPFIMNGKSMRVSSDIPYEFVLKDKAGDACATVEAVDRTNLAHHHPEKDQHKEFVEGELINKVEPDSQMDSRGETILQATIGKDGLIHDLKPLCGPPEIVQASIDAVQQWRYRPYLLEGDPVDMEITIVVRINLPPR